MTPDYIKGLDTAALIVQAMAGDKESPYSHAIMRYRQTMTLRMEQNELGKTYDRTIAGH